MTLYETIFKWHQAYNQLMNDEAYAKKYKMPGQAYFTEEGDILALPREDGDCRYPYGKNGFNFWTYASGYMHANEGLYSPFLRATEGQEPKIAFFAKVEGIVFPMLSVPVMHHPFELEVKRYTVFTQDATYFMCEFKGILFGVKASVDEVNHLDFQVTAQLLVPDQEAKTISLSTFMNPFVKNGIMENSTDRWFRKGAFIPNDQAGAFVIEAYEEKDRGAMAANYGILSCAETIEGANLLLNYETTTSRYQYVGGTRSSLHTPKALFNGTFGNGQQVCTFTETAICGDLRILSLANKISLQYQFASTDEEQVKEALVREGIHNIFVDNTSCQTASSITMDDQNLHISEEKHQPLKIEFFEGENEALQAFAMNHFMTHLQKQIAFCSTIKGYIQLSSFSLIGIRDVFQALEGYVYDEPSIVRSKMLEALNFMSPEGRCPRQYGLPTHEGQKPAMDLRPFIDQGVWVISTVMTYLRMTKDFGFLKEWVGYYDFVDEAHHVAVRSGQKSTVLTHLMEIMAYLMAQRDHAETKCVLALYGDWNDALDGLGKSTQPDKAYGTGVSVMASLQVYQNLSEMIELLSALNQTQYADICQQYAKAQAEIQEGLLNYAVQKQGEQVKLVHGWGDARSYYVGSFDDPDHKSRDGITSNAFMVLSGLYDQYPEFHQPILEAYERLDSKYGFKTFEPSFEKGTPGVGRIPNLPAGTAENGASYIHAGMFGVMSLFRMGESEKAWQQLLKLLPLTHETISVSPYVMPNSYGDNPALHIDGESMQDWQTGSSNVLLKTVVRYILGFEPHLTGVFIQPAQGIPFKETHYAIHYLGKRLEISLKKANMSSPRKYVVNGQEIAPVYDPVMKLWKLWLPDELLNQMSASTVQIEVKNV